MPGRVEAIHLAEEVGGPTFSVESVEAVMGLGLAGDRLVRQARTTGESIEPKRQVTLIEGEALDAIRRDYDLTMTSAESRRNICTRGVSLNHLVDQEFNVGEVRLRGIELCEPCATLEKLSGKRGAVRALLHRGGLRAEVVSPGTIRVGDPVGSENPAESSPASSSGEIG